MPISRQLRIRDRDGPKIHDLGKHLFILGFLRDLHDIVDDLIGMSGLATQYWPQKKAFRAYLLLTGGRIGSDRLHVHIGHCLPDLFSFILVAQSSHRRGPGKLSEGRVKGLPGPALHPNVRLSVAARRVGTEVA